MADVLAGEIVTNIWIRKAIERHQRDMKSAAARGLYFDRAAANRPIEFIETFCCHSKGEWAGKPLLLEPWEQCLVWILFGWMKTGGLRRFRTAYVEIARKNGKSSLAAAIALYLLVADNEMGAEIYAAATKKDQAKIVWEEAGRMVNRSPLLKQRITVLRTNLNIPSTASKFEPLGADSEKQDGLNIHAAIIDELHAHKNRGLYDVIETATGARQQPVIFNITTAGSDRQSVCYELHEYGERVLDEVVQDDTFFVMIFAIDKDDDWTDERVWVKANPNLGISVKPDDLQRKCHQAKEIPAKQNSFRRLHLNQWTEQDTRWLDLDLWDQNAGAVDEDALAGRACYPALDLSSTTDISSLSLIFPPEEEDEPWKIVQRFWVPEDTITKRSREDRVPYDVWVKQGFIEATDGNVVDYEVIRARTLELSGRFEFREFAYDPWNATQLATQLGNEGLTMVQFRQGFASFAGPCREFEKLLLGRQLAHAGNPVLRWMAQNVVAEEDAAGNRKPSKAKSRERVDGIVSVIMGIGRATLSNATISIYESEGLFVL
jgi:phage terminase large subunit-like protein